MTALEAEAAASPVGANGVMLVPYWEGCMTPHWDASARGVIAGLSGSTRRGDLYRALLEGVVLEQALASRRLQGGCGHTIDHYVAVGGGTASNLWMQILADATAWSQEFIPSAMSSTARSEPRQRSPIEAILSRPACAPEPSCSTG